MHPIILLYHACFFFFIFQAITASAILGPGIVLSFDPEYGIFGWLSDWGIVVYMFTAVAPIFGLVNNIWFYIKKIIKDKYHNLCTSL